MSEPISPQAHSALGPTQAMDTIVGIVKRLVETATFTLSRHDFTALERAITQYEAPVRHSQSSVEAPHGPCCRSGTTS